MKKKYIIPATVVYSFASEIVMDATSTQEIGTGGSDITDDGGVGAKDEEFGW